MEGGSARGCAGCGSRCRHGGPDRGPTGWPLPTLIRRHRGAHQHGEDRRNSWHPRYSTQGTFSARLCWAWTKCSHPTLLADRCGCIDQRRAAHRGCAAQAPKAVGSGGGPAGQLTAARAAVLAERPECSGRALSRGPARLLAVLCATVCCLSVQHAYCPNRVSDAHTLAGRQWAAGRQGRAAEQGRPGEIRWGRAAEQATGSLTAAGRRSVQP